MPNQDTENSIAQSWSTYSGTETFNTKPLSTGPASPDLASAMQNVTNIKGPFEWSGLSSALVRAIQPSESPSSPSGSAFGNTPTPYTSSFKAPATMSAAQYEGSISMKPISVSKDGNGGWSQSGGFAFDLPLSTVAAFQNNALMFTAQNSDINKGFFSNVLNNQSANMMGTAQMASGLSQSAINASTAIAGVNAEVARTVANNALEFGRISQDAQTERTRLETGAASESGGGGCFFTTAVCEHWKLADNCEILQTMRAFRDDVMMVDGELLPLVREYYDRAPEIVAKIDAMPNAAEIWEYVGNFYILPGVALCKIGANKMALLTYRKMCLYLEKLTGV